LKVITIGIRFSDNDFYYTLTAFLSNLGYSLKAMERIQSSTREDARKYVAELFNRSAPGLYWLRQNCLGYGLEWKPEEYLKIEPDKVFFDEENQAYLLEHGQWQNGEYFMMTVGGPGANQDKPYVWSC
jgi:hypothetical protein